MGTGFIARPEAMNVFIQMQPEASAALNRNLAAAAARARGGGAGEAGAGAGGVHSPTRQGRADAGRPARQPAPPPSPPSGGGGGGCLCFSSPKDDAGDLRPSRSSPPPPPLPTGTGGGTGGRPVSNASAAASAVAAEPPRVPWSPDVEWQIVACVELLQREGLDEPNLFAVSAVDAHVRRLRVRRGAPLPAATDPHVATGAIKAHIRAAETPLVPAPALQAYIAAAGAGPAGARGSGGSGGGVGAGAPLTPGGMNPSTDSPSAAAASAAAGIPPATGGAGGGGWKGSHLARTLAAIEATEGSTRAGVFGRLMLLLGRITARVEVSRMNAHCLAKCIAPSLLHWDAVSTFSLLTLGKITAFVMAMVEEARLYDELLGVYCEEHPVLVQ
ncbi:hypothetical protein MMPV_000087 [Pyropia vietnamensis]